MAEPMDLMTERLYRYKQLLLLGVPQAEAWAASMTKELFEAAFLASPPLKLKPADIEGKEIPGGSLSGIYPLDEVKMTREQKDLRRAEGRWLWLMWGLAEERLYTGVVGEERDA